jgi:hypothetical protein
VVKAISLAPLQHGQRPLSDDDLAADKNSTREEIIAAWNELKKLDVPKDYASWVKARATHKVKSR